MTIVRIVNERDLPCEVAKAILLFTPVPTGLKLKLIHSLKKNNKKTEDRSMSAAGAHAIQF